MIKLMLFFITLSIITLFLFYFIITSKARKKEINIDIIEELEKSKSKFKLNTKITLLEKCNATYDVIKDEIEMKKEKTIETLCHGFHELGHAFYNTYNNHLLYDKNNNIIKHDNKREEIETFPTIIEYFLYYSVVLSMITTFLNIAFESKFLFLGSFALSFIALIVQLENIQEEIKASIIGYKMIKEKELLDKQDLKLVKYSLLGALSTYFFVTLVCLGFTIFNIFIIYKVFNIYLSIFLLIILIISLCYLSIKYKLFRR